MEEKDELSENALRQKLEIAENHYRSLFEGCLVPIWEEDFSKVKDYLEDLKKSGVTNIRSYFTEHPEKIAECFNLLVAIDTNQSAVELNEAGTKENLLANYKNFLSHDSNDYAIKQFEAIANNHNECSFEATLKTFNNNERHVFLKWIVVKGYEGNYKRVLLSTKDLTDLIISENQMLQSSNKEKEALLKEVHHRVKNNLQIVTSLLNLQSHAIKDSSTKEIFETSLNRIKSMASVHEMLYQSDDFSKIEYQTYLTSLTVGLLNSVKGENTHIKLNLHAKGIHLNINTCIPLGLMITEIITNSLKHGNLNEQNGNIYVDLIKNDNSTYKLTVGDNGDGVPDEVNLKTPATLGLQLIASLVDQLSGSYFYDFTKPGTHYVIEFTEQK